MARRQTASPAHYAPPAMTWVAVIFTPVVLPSPGGTYWIFGRRLARPAIPAGATGTGIAGTEVAGT